MTKRRGPSRMLFTPEMDAQLRALRGLGEPSLMCAVELGVCTHVVERRMRELNLNQRLNRGRISGVRAIRR